MSVTVARYKYPLSLAMAVICAGGAIYLTKYYFDVREKQLREKIRMESQLTDVVVATMNLSTGDPINLTTMMIKSIPFEFVPDGAVTPEQYTAVENKFLSSPVSAGKPLVRHFVEGVSRVERFSDLLAFGERAITLEVDDIASVAHMLEAGDYIDLGVKYQKSREFQLLLENIRVLSTGNLTVADPKFPDMYKTAQYSSITLGVDSRYVQDIYEAENNGDLVFLLRNEKDDHTARYEENGGAEGSVTVYAGDSAENGVMKASREKISQFLTVSDTKRIARNSEGKMLRISTRLATNTDKKNTRDVVNEVVESK